MLVLADTPSPLALAQLFLIVPLPRRNPRQVERSTTPRGWPSPTSIAGLSRKLSEHSTLEGGPLSSCSRRHVTFRIRLWGASGIYHAHTHFGVFLGGWRMRNALPSVGPPALLSRCVLPSLGMIDSWLAAFSLPKGHAVVRAFLRSKRVRRHSNAPDLAVHRSLRFQRLRHS